MDLSKAGLIEGTFNTASSFSPQSSISNAALPLFLPSAKIGRGNYLYVYSGGLSYAGNGFQWQSIGINFVGISNIGSIDQYASITSNPGLAVAEAYSIDKKTDDGLPQTGRVLALYISQFILWTDGTSPVYNSSFFTPNSSAVPGSAATCYDNGNTAGATQQYSVEVSNGAGVNCGLSFRFQ